MTLGNVNNQIAKRRGEVGTMDNERREPLPLLSKMGPVLVHTQLTVTILSMKVQRFVSVDNSLIAKRTTDENLFYDVLF